MECACEYVDHKVGGMCAAHTDAARRYATAVGIKDKNRRDRFAMAALTGLLANGDFGQEATVSMSAQIADALIAELDKEK